MSKLTLLCSLVVLILAIGYVELRRPDPAADGGAEATAPDRPDRIVEAIPPAGWMPPQDPRINEILARLDRIEQAAGLRAATGAGVPVPGPDSSGATPPPEVAAGANAAPADPKKAAEVRKFLAKVRAGTVSEEQIGEVWEHLMGSGLEDEAIAAFRGFVKDNPNEPNAYYGLAVALTTKLLGGKTSLIEQGRLGGEADRLYSKTLELDDEHFGARFSKAYGLTFWPDSAGKGPVAVKHFEVLRTRHGRDNGNELMKEVYISLGGQYRKAGQFKKAAEVYKEGFATFPNSERLKAQMETIGK